MSRLLTYFLSLLFYTVPLQAVIVANPIQVNISIEDGEMQQAVITQVKFNREELDLSKKSFMHRKVSHSLHIPPGQYQIEWTTEKFKKPWGDDKETKTHQKVIVIEMSDAVVYLNIRGETFWIY